MKWVEFITTLRLTIMTPMMMELAHSHGTVKAGARLSAP